jgi:four helix bundle protein
MRYERFEQLPVWQAGLTLAREVYEFTERHRLRPSLRDQLERAALSVSNNIAEGFERGTTQELLAFIYVARGSAGEVRSMLHLLEALPGNSNLKSQISHLRSIAEGVSRQLYAWARNLKESPIKGQRHLTEASRRQAKQDRDREAFLAQISEVTAKAQEERDQERRAAQSPPKPDTP